MRTRLQQDQAPGLPPAGGGGVRLNGLSGLSDFIERASPELAANAMLCAVNQAAYLLKRQLESQSGAFLEKGGFTEKLYGTRKRVLGGPGCPSCGKPMNLRTARKGSKIGQQFWGCSAYPDCKATLPHNSGRSDRSHPPQNPTARVFGLVLLCLLTLGCSSTRNSSAQLRVPCFAFLELTNFSRFTSQAGSENSLLSPVLVAPIAFTELIVSWNADLPKETGLQVEAQAISPNHSTRFYNLGFWSEQTNAYPRQSIRGQRDADGQVRTDTLVLKQPTSDLQIRFTLFPNKEGAIPRIKLLGLSFASAPRTNCPSSITPGAAWGREIKVPELSQLSSADGREWCSPTCVAMVLNYWGQTLHRAELQVQLPEVAHAIYDPNWPGTGNWPFNTAYAGHFAGIKAYVRRFNDLAEIEPWIKNGVPIILSISSDALHGRPIDRHNGHLVVCRGFTADGDVIINNPWADYAAGQTVKRTYERARVIRAWASSRNTAYVIFPDIDRTDRGDHDRPSTH